MALTASVKEELSRLDIKKSSVRKAEVSAMLRFAGGLHIISGRIVIEAEVDLASTARRLRAAIAEVYGHQSEIIVVSGGGLRRGSRYVVRVVRDGEALARQTGLLDARGRPVRGLPSVVVNGSAADAEAVWRGAFLAHGSLTEPGRSSAMEVTCPGPESALALVGAARRLGIQAKAREVRGVDRVVIRDGDTIAALLTRMGAHDALMVWEERRMRKEVRATANRLANFDDANLRRSAQAAVAAGARVDRALEILGDDVPDHLKYAGELRVAHKQASLDELGRLADPVMTKDAIAGPDPPPAGHGGQTRPGPRHPRHGGQCDAGNAGRVASHWKHLQNRIGPAGIPRRDWRLFPLDSDPETSGCHNIRMHNPRVTKTDNQSTTLEDFVTEYVLPDLSYDYAALEPHISARIMELHHSKHHAAYVAGANNALAQLAEARDKGDFANINRLSKDLAFHTGGHINHSVFWNNLSPDGGDKPEGELAAAIDDAFGSFDAFRAHFSAAALALQGSGWAFLAYEPIGGNLVIEQLYDQQGNVAVGTTPLLMLDMWEHAFYLDYVNVKADYVKAFWNIVNWADVAKRFDAARKNATGLITL